MKWSCADEQRLWWKNALVYQIYPLSFQDSNADGWGDIPGIIARLEYLAWLGVDAIWLSPVFPSPMLDFGYDISDFTGIDPVFGTMEDFDRLVREAHDRRIRVILDFVPNHTADRHPWFLESRQSRDNPKSDWYVWADPKPDGGPPNNWLSRFGESAWRFDPWRGQYFYHAFLPEQPDLNWRNPQVREAMAGVLRFWMKRGVDGFRMDAAAVLAEDAELRDEPPNPDYEEGRMPPQERHKRTRTDSQPDGLPWLGEMRRVVEEYPDCLLLGEVDTTPEKVPDFYGEKADRLHLPLNHLLLDTEWSAPELAKAIGDYLSSLPDHAWPDWVLGSHDKKRVASKKGPECTRLAALLALTLPGTACIYAGDEIGMPDAPVEPAHVRDLFEKLVPGFGLGRDPHRAPMRWDDSDHFGFTKGEPWLVCGELKPECNVEAQRADPASLAQLYRRLIELRHRSAALGYGSFEILSDEAPDLLLCARLWRRAPRRPDEPRPWALYGYGGTMRGGARFDDAEGHAAGRRAPRDRAEAGAHRACRVIGREPDGAHMVAGRHHLPDLPALVSGFEW